ncbi:MAG: hypothetical protein QMD36_01435 [Candidatus Aenigmarchaeota archaeon]|nr:hypothetical protein [Candidatus Aenigmarchaeota archaeon]
MRKGLNALELIFTLFVLIVVVLVVVRMFITKMTLGGIEKPVQDITDTYNYEAAYSTCNNLCSKYESDCGNVQNAVRFCLQKINIDIDGNRVTGERGHYNVVEQIPMCEDGIYCFHIKTDCLCGSQRLDPSTCLSVLCDYYKNIHGLSSEVAMNAIRNGISWGTCPKDVINDWKIKDYTPIEIEPGEFMGPDYWWVRAGYDRAECP